MKYATLYHIASGAVLTNLSGPDEADFSGHASAEVGVYDGVLDRDTQYVTGGAAATRTVATFTAPATATVGDAVTISGLPDPCWLRVLGEIVQVTGGSVTRSPTVARELRVELVGAYTGSATITINSAEQTSLDADPRWQALQAATPQQIEDWLTANVTTLATARGVLKLLLLAVRKLGA